MLILKGIVIGIGKIIPGVSGSMLAISMGIYQQMLDSINNFFKNTKENFKFLFKIGLGVIISIIFFSNIILKCLNKYYLITMFFFIGLILGSTRDIKQNIDKKNNLIVILSFLFITILGLFNLDNHVDINNNILYFFYYLIAGIIDAITMVIPGISGTATLMMYGAYNDLITAFSRVLNIYYLIPNLKILIPFIIGLLIGILVTVKIVDYLFKYHKSKTYSAILGFSTSTILLMGIKCINTNYTLYNLIIGIIFLLLGIISVKKLNHYFD